MDEITDQHIANGWFDIARAGKWYGTQGGESAEIEVSREDLAQMAADYSPQIQEAPVTFDHIKWGPAHGWIAELRLAGEILQARLKLVSDELRTALKSGTYRSRSIEMYKPHSTTGRAYLGALSFLGAQPPAAKGLQPVPQLFTEGASNSQAWLEPAEFTPSKTEEVNAMSMDEKQVTELAESAARKSVKETLKDFLGLGEKPDPTGDLAGVRAKLSEVKAETAKLSESLAAEKKRADEATAKLAEHEQAAELAEFKETIETAKKDSRITPAEAAGYVRLGERLDSEGRKVLLTEVAERKDNKLLSEHAGKDGQQSTGRMAAERASLAKVIEAQGGTENDDHKHSRACYDLMEAPGNEKMTFTEASRAVGTATAK